MIEERKIVKVKEIPLWGIIVFLLSTAFGAGGFASQIIELQRVNKTQDEAIVDLDETHERDMDALRDQFYDSNSALVTATSELTTAIEVLKTELKNATRVLERRDD